MSTEAGCTHFSSNGSMPMRPAAIALRMSRSERTTSSQYAGTVVSVLPEEDGADQRRGVALAAAATGRGANRLRDRKRDLLCDAAVAHLLTQSDERRKLVVQGIDIRGPRIHDLEPQVAQRIALSQPLEDHLPDPLRRDLGETALPEARLEVLDEPADLVWGERLRPGLLDRAGQLAPVKLLPGPVPFENLDTRRLAPLERGEALLAAVTDAPAADRGPVLRLTRVDDACVGVAARRTAHGHKIWEEGLLNLVAEVGEGLGGCPPHENTKPSPR